VRRLGFLVIVPTFFMLSLAVAGEGDKDKDKENDNKAKKEKPEEKKKIVLPTKVIANVETKDGSRFACEFSLDQTVTIRTPDLGAVKLKLEVVRFIDAEGPVARIATHALEDFNGIIETDEFRGKMPATREPILLRRERLKRIAFPDPIREF
jgi:hypothetical protein